MPIADPEKRRQYDKARISRPEIKQRNNEAARKRYHEKGFAAKREYDAERRKDPEHVARRKQYMLNRKLTNWAVAVLPFIKSRAKKKGLSFNITADDIPLPDVCPIFGTKLIIGIGKQGNDSPSIDRIDPAKGYVKGNVVVISQRANSLKREASLADLETMVAFYRKHVNVS
jgi:hypothetical protein